MLNEQFKTQIEDFIQRVGITPTTFGRMALGDPNFISQLRNGRLCSLKTAEKICAFMESYDQKWGAYHNAAHK
jgi:hypothetical protein